MCSFAERLGLHSGGTGEQDIRSLRQEGLTDREILDLVLVIAYYSYVNRIASGLGVPLEPERGGVVE